ncbi:stress responsive A/B barrel domain-containing protein [Biscogniauxia sp. FL1348]|nr:stress responsive A/B barrel domain-containing protein [Biscogniauxia sp. FL1348]
MSGRIHRVTMFKVPEPEGQQRLIEAYKVLAQNQKRDGKPYILSTVTGRVIDEQRSHGWTVVNKSEFASIEDMRYYDEACEAHAALKAKAKTFGITGGPAGVLMACFHADATL